MGNRLMINARIVTPQGTTARCGEEMKQLLDLPNGFIEITEGVITAIGTGQHTLKKGYELLYVQGKEVLPGVVASHTHLVFGG